MNMVKGGGGGEGRIGSRDFPADDDDDDDDDDDGGDDLHEHQARGHWVADYDISRISP